MICWQWWCWRRTRRSRTSWRTTISRRRRSRRRSRCRFTPRACSVTSSRISVSAQASSRHFGWRGWLVFFSKKNKKSLPTIQAASVILGPGSQQTKCQNSNHQNQNSCRWLRIVRPQNSLITHINDFWLKSGGGGDADRPHRLDFCDWDGDYGCKPPICVQKKKQF